MIQETPIKKIDKKNKGFTLLEVMVVIAIFGILTTMFVYNYSDFTDDATLTNMAYELALSVREAQVYGVAVTITNQTSSSFDDEYGVSFSEDNKDYFLFVDSLNKDLNEYNGGISCSTQECKKTYTLQRQTIISDVSIKKGTDSFCDSSPLTQLDILFKRPNPEPIINNDLSVSQAQIELKSREGKTKYVIVSSNGQIYVTGESECS